MSPLGHYKSIDGLRAWMAWWVVLQHVLQLGGMNGEMPPLLYRLLTSGGVAVSVFIIISGYVICHLLLSERESYRVYILRRFLRVYPLFLFALLLSIILQNVYIDVFTAHTWIEGVQYRTERAAQESEHFLTYFMLHISLLHGVLPDSVLPYSSTAFLAPAWSLSLEWQFYLVAPLIMLIFTAKKWMVSFSVAMVLLFAILCVYLLGWKWDVPSNLFLSLGYFLIGMSTRYVMQSDIRHIWLAVVLALVGFIMAYVNGHSSSIDLVLTVVIWSSVLVAFRLEMTHKNTELPWYVYIFRSLFFGKFITELGKWSYSTYLLHIPILTIVIFAANSMGLEGRYGYVTTMFLSIPLLLYVSRLSYVWLEKPAIVYGKKIISKKNDVAK